MAAVRMSDGNDTNQRRRDPTPGEFRQLRIGSLQRGQHSTIWLKTNVYFCTYRPILWKSTSDETHTPVALFADYYQAFFFGPI